MSWYWYLVGILALAVLMVVHESGHFFVARAFGMRVTKFSIGFGPTFFRIVPKDGYYWFTSAADRVQLRLWKHDPERHGPTVYQVGMIPFLAYVQIAGMNPLEEIDDTDKGSYVNAGVVGRILTIFAGPAANYLFASVLFFASFFFGGRPATHDEVTSEVVVLDGRPAAAAHMKSGDRVVEIDGVPVASWDKMAENVSRHPGQTITIVVEHGGQRVPLTITTDNEHGKGKIGVTPFTHRVPVSAAESLQLAIKTPAIFVRDQIVSIGQWAAGKAQGELSGPAGMVKETARAAQSGWIDLLYLLGALSALLGAFNLFPIPALDGGRLMFLGYEATTRRRPNARIEANVHAIGLVMMLGLMLYVTFVNDLRLTGRPPLDADKAAAPSAATAQPSTTGEAPAQAGPTASPDHVGGDPRTPGPAGGK
jgi:regulator of sigma E protease